MELTGINSLTSQPVKLIVEDGRIKTIKPVAPSPDLPWIAPGFLDAQINGLDGHDYSGDDLGEAAVRGVMGAVIRSGTTRHVATIVTSSRERILKNLSTIADLRGTHPEVAAAIAAVHVEGPFIAPEDGPRGAHDPQWVRDPDVGELREWHAAARGCLKLITLAPERPGAIPVIHEATQLGITVAIGHTAADDESVDRAVDAGATLSTHLGNGSHANLPRLHNYLWKQLATDGLRAGLIGDGYHLPESVMRVFVRSKGLDRLMLVSDVGPCAGLPVGIHEWGSIRVEVHRDGHLGLAGTSFLAGGGHLLDRCIPIFARATSLPLQTVIPLCTANPARFLDLPAPGLEEGSMADLVMFRWDGVAPQLDIQRVFQNGKEVGL